VVKFPLLLILLTVLTGLSACGMQGPLYLPDEDSEKAEKK
jgi:predicted small lipoprotein YifL